MTLRTNDFRFEPYWWVEDPCAGLPRPANLPERADVVIIGGGVTGVEAGYRLAAGGRDVVILDSGSPGAGASSRNAGQIGRNFKHSFGELLETRGLDVAKRYFGELREAYDAIADLGEAEGDAIGWRKRGRVVAAMTPRLFAKLQCEYELRARHIGEEIEVVGSDAIGGEMHSHLYYGAVRILENGAIQPARYYRFLRDRALGAGARIFAHTAAQAVGHEPGGFAVRTRHGTVQARDVIVATNGYTGIELPWFKRRLAPIDAFMIATEPLAPETVAQILPMARTYHDNRRRSHFMTFSPDGDRLMFGGRTGALPSALPRITRELEADLRFFFPALAEVRISHAWTGRCAGTADLFPHMGSMDGLHYALGYCFSGMAMGPYLARKIAARILGREEEAESLFDSSHRFAALPIAARGPWVGPLLAGYWAWADRPKGLERRI